MMKSDKMKDIPKNELIQYLQRRLTEEELSEVLNNLGKDDNLGEEVELRNTTQIEKSPSLSNYNQNSVPSLPNQDYQKNKGGGSGLMQAVNVGAISAVTSMGISYLISNMKDKKEQEVNIIILISRYFNA